MVTQKLDYEPGDNNQFHDIECITATRDTWNNCDGGVHVQPSWYDSANVSDNYTYDECVKNNQDYVHLDAAVVAEVKVPVTEIISSDDEDDDVNIIIGKHGVGDDSYQDFIDSYLDKDSALNNEIKILVSEIVHRNINMRNYQENTVTIFAQQTPIPIPIDTAISPQLSAHVWGLEHNYKKFNIRHSESFNKLVNNYMKPVNRTSNHSDFGKTIAFFSAVYENLSKSTTTLTNRGQNKINLPRFQKNTNGASVESAMSVEHTDADLEEGEISGNESQWKQLINKNLFFKDFSVIILHDGEFIDAAIHGKYSSISEVLKKYDPTVIYCMGNERDPINAFVNYKYQPFYSVLRSRIRYVTGSLFRSNSTLMFCPQNAKFCSFCRCIDTILTHYININITNIIPLEFSEKNINKYPKINRPKRTSPYYRLGGMSDNYRERAIRRNASEPYKPSQYDETYVRDVRHGTYPKIPRYRQNSKQLISHLHNEPRYTEILSNTNQFYARPPEPLLSNIIDEYQHPRHIPYKILHSGYRMQLRPRNSTDRLKRTITVKQAYKNNLNYDGYRYKRRRKTRRQLFARVSCRTEISVEITRLKLAVTFATPDIWTIPRQWRNIK